MAGEDEWMSIKQACGYCGRHADTLAARRNAGRPPVYYVRTGTIAYKRSDLDAWLAGIPVLPTKES